MSHKKSGDAPVKVHPRNPMGLVLLFGAVVTERSEVAQEVQKVRRSNVTIEVHISDTAYIHDALAQSGIPNGALATGRLQFGNQAL